MGHLLFGKEFSKANEISLQLQRKLGMLLDYKCVLKALLKRVFLTSL